ncbi:MAG: two-component system CheB/CheR fusion protein [Candidatus Azotimanducaceae bacterium]|jgi:two-component system CheB/CheR fusion protein
MVAMGASAGGLEAFETFFSAMPAETGMAFIVIVHLDPTHVSLLSELLQRHTKIPVQQIQNGMRVSPNHIYIIPPNKGLSVFAGKVSKDLPEF